MAWKSEQGSNSSKFQVNYLCHWVSLVIKSLTQLCSHLQSSTKIFILPFLVTIYAHCSQRKKKANSSKTGKEEVKIMKTPPLRSNLYLHSGGKNLCIYVNTETRI